jgi:hypothetical protein
VDVGGGLGRVHGCRSLHEAVHKINASASLLGGVNAEEQVSGFWCVRKACVSLMNCKEFIM